MSVPLTLGVPDRPDPQALVARLLHPRCHTADDVNRLVRSVTTGPPVVTASALTSVAATVDLGRVVVDLDVDPSELRSLSGITYEAVRYHVRADDETLAEAVALRLPSPLVVFPELADGSTMDTVTAIVEAHRTPGFDASTPSRRIADILAVVAHAEVGFVARASSGSEVLAVLAATVAALRGDDIQAALAAPDLSALAALRPEAAQAVRTVLLGIEVDDLGAAHDALVAAALVGPGSSTDRPPTT